MTKFLVAALLGAFVFSSIARAEDVTVKKNKIESIRIVPKKDRTIASEDDGFVPLMQPKPQKRKTKRVLAN